MLFAYRKYPLKNGVRLAQDRFDRKQSRETFIVVVWQFILFVSCMRDSGNLG